LKYFFFTVEETSVQILIDSEVPETLFAVSGELHEFPVSKPEVMK